jgi:hypothetical protein
MLSAGYVFPLRLMVLRLLRQRFFGWIQGTAGVNLRFFLFYIETCAVVGPVRRIICRDPVILAKVLVKTNFALLKVYIYITPDPCLIIRTLRRGAQSLLLKKESNYEGQSNHRKQQVGSEKDY